MGEIKTYRDLYAWQVGMETVSLTYEITAEFPVQERFGLIAQMRRAAVSIPSNVAEGQGLKKTGWSLRHISIAIGSSLELETQLEVALRLGFVSRARVKALVESLDRVQKLLYGLHRKKLRITEGAIVSASVVVMAALYVFTR